MTLKQFARIVEIRTKIVSISTFTLATLYVVFATGTFSLPLFILTLVAALCVDMGTTSFNSYFDFVRGVDSSIFNVEEDKILVHEGIDARRALAVSLSLYAAAVVFGTVISIFTSYWIAIAGSVCMAIGFLYTGGPLPISRTPVGELFAGGFLGSVFFVIVFFIQAGHLTGAAVLASVPSTLFIMSILTVNNTCDIDGDSAAGRKTLSILIGRRAGEILVYLLGGIAYGGAALLSVLRVLPVWTLIPLALGLVVIVPVYRRMHANGFSHATKGPSMGRISRAFLLFSLVIAIGLSLGIILKAV